MSRFITAQTTDEQILAPVERAKENLVTTALEAQQSEYMQGEKLVQAAQAVRNAEALAHVQMRFRDVSASKPENRLPMLLDLLTSSPDDEWSGRGNDSRRSSNDAIREWVRDTAREVQYEMRRA